MATVTTPPKQPPVFNLPNQLTAARLVLGIVLFVLIGAGEWMRAAQWIACIIVFALAALTDYLDGYFARKQGLTSTLGRNLDPLVDKVVISGAYIFLVPIGSRSLTDGGSSGVMAWMVTVVVGRELVITSLRSFMESYGASFGADWLGKIKMGLQCGALFGVFVALLAHGTGVEAALQTIRDGLLYAMVAATALSGIQYLWKAFAVLKVD